MLYFSKLRVFSVLIFTLIFSYFTLSNFIKVDDEYFSKNIKLGLDLQGGSHLLLEVKNHILIDEELENILSFFRLFLRNEKIKLMRLVLLKIWINFTFIII